MSRDGPWRQNLSDHLLLFFACFVPHRILNSVSEPWTVPDQVNALLDIATGMEYLHSHDTMHRDLKSLNVLRDERGWYKVADFGQSKSSTLSTTLASSTGGKSSGTPAWKAPELFKRKPATYR